MFRAYSASVPVERTQHVPFVEPDVLFYWHAVRLSAARCARVSYGRPMAKSVEEDLVLAGTLQTSGHMSPFEHAARVAFEPVPGRRGNLTYPWLPYRTDLPGEDCFAGDPAGFCRNYFEEA